MSSCEFCPLLTFKRKFDLKKVSFLGPDGKRNDVVVNAFGIVMERFNRSPLNKDCPMGENGCPAIYRREMEKLNQLEQK